MEQIKQAIGTVLNTSAAYIPKLLAAFGVLVAGWIIALVISHLIRRWLANFSLNKKISKYVTEEIQDESYKPENWISVVVFYFLMIIVLVGFFQILGIEAITVPLNQFLEKIFAYIPRIIGAGILFLVAFILAKMLRFATINVMHPLNIDTRFGKVIEGTEKASLPLTKSIADIVYWLVMLLFTLQILDFLSFQGILQPVQQMTGKIFRFLPNLLTGIVIITLGVFIANVLKKIVTSLLDASGIDTLCEKIGLGVVFGKEKASKLLGLLVQVLLIISAVVIAFEALHISIITEPVTAMLQKILLAVPNIIAAVLLMLVAFIAGKICSGFACNMLKNIGFDGILCKIGLANEDPKDNKLSEIGGKIVFVGILFFASIEALSLLHFENISIMLNHFFVFAAKILVSIVIFAVGLYLSNLAAKTIRAGNTPQSEIIAAVARISIIVLATAMALNYTGVAKEIIDMAFGLTLGAVAVAFAIAFGLGGREIAAKRIEKWLEALNKK